MLMLKSLALLPLGAVLLSGCAEVGERDLPPERIYVSPRTAEAVSPDGSIFSQIAQDGLLGQERARGPGDLVTVLIEENVTASTSASNGSSRTSKTTALSAGALKGIDTAFAKAGLPWPLDMNPAASGIDSSGKGTAAAEGNIKGQLTAVVTEVMPNGLLAIRAYKRMQLSTGSQIVRLNGLVRPSDIQPDNTVRSRRLADADISFAGAGELADASRSGWMNRALLRFWPF
jgi:flagellar L-ring protein precursor FlgH